MKFWDSSAIIPLLVDEPTSKVIDALRVEDPVMVVSALASVEIVGALWRQVRGRKLAEERRIAAEMRLAELERIWTTVTDILRVVRIARRLLASHSVRSADALQLGAALAAAEDQALLSDFVTLDRRLAEAARRQGFQVITA